MSAEPNPPLVSTRAELRNLRNNSQATVAELKAFLRELKGRNPQEMLGMVAGNQLFRATIHAMILIIAVMLVFTVIPYLTRETPTPVVAPAPAETSPAETSPAETSPAETSPAKSSPAKSSPAETPAEVPPTPALPDPLEELGVGEEKPAPRDVNPLDTGTGSFLDELE